ncbi:AAA family ATPase [Corallococcus exiguus]|uniref:ATP-binding protein n=1 Tax=Corallococcus exiguus TaxID=83462 RepID=UPI0014740CF1|nr:ATP-binding protein [Corallococcus exiguus]NNB96604.1 AAA family ATPase [Corallococcus exiguus]
MYVKEVHLSNIRSIESLDWKVPDGSGPGWHVVIGDNGAGKSSFLRAIALSLIGPLEARALRQDWNEWLRRGTEKGIMRVWLRHDQYYDEFTDKKTYPAEITLPAVIMLHRFPPDAPIQTSHVAFLPPPSVGVDAELYTWGDTKGWFSASYGPFRRFTGVDSEQEKIFASSPKLARHLSVFGESIALSESIEWLKLLQFKKLENDPEGNLLESLKQFINQPGFLTNETRLESISSKGVRFVDGNGCVVPVENLSDGYRSILSMTFELIRQLARAYGADKIFTPGDATTIIVPGVVLIDEIDAHLHPVWQRRVGRWFREHFPNIQFIVTTHSPLICQAATVGSVFRLPRPGSDEEAGMVTGVALDRLLYGNVLDAYSTGAFGAVDLRSDEGMEKLERLATLNQKELAQGLSSEEQTEQQQLRARLPTASSALPSDTEVPQP